MTGVLGHAGYRSRGVDNPGLCLDLRGRMDSMLCNIGSPHEGTHDRSGSETGVVRGGQGHSHRSIGEAFGHLVRRLKHDSCLMVSHRLKAAEDRADRLARSLGVDLED